MIKRGVSLYPERGGREQLRPGRVGATRQWYSEQRTARLSLSPLQVRHRPHSIPPVCYRVLNTVGIVSGCYDDDFESSAAEMSEEESVTEMESGGERGGERESSEAHSTEDEELTESLQELSQQVSSLENTLTTSGSHQVHILQPGLANCVNILSSVVLAHHLCDDVFSPLCVRVYV